MKFTVPAMILLAVSMPTVCAADAPQMFVIRIGSDGKVEVKDALPPDVEKKVQEARVGDRSKEEAKQGDNRQGDKGPGIVVKGMDVRGSISVVGPSGVMYSQNFGAAGEASPDVEQLLEQSLQAAGADLPETVRQALKQAFQQQEQTSGTQPAGEAADISSKLDRILARLEKIEQQIGRLKAAEKPNNE